MEGIIPFTRKDYRGETKDIRKEPSEVREGEFVELKKSNRRKTITRKEAE